MKAMLLLHRSVFLTKTLPIQIISNFYLFFFGKLVCYHTWTKFIFLQVLWITFKFLVDSTQKPSCLYLFILYFPQNLTLYGALCNVYVEVYSVYFNQLG